MSKRSALVSRLAGGKTKALTLAVILTMLGLGAILPYVAESQFAANTLTINSQPSGSNPTIRAEGLDANIGITLVPKGTGAVSFGSSPFSSGAATFSSLTVTGLSTTASLDVTAGEARIYFIRAVDHCRADTPAATLVAARIGLGDWALARTAAGAETYNITCNFPFPYQLTALKGWRLDSFSVAHQITVVNLTSATFGQLSQVVYANNVANAVSTYGGAIGITLPTVVQANPYLTAATVGTPAFVGTANNSVNIEYQVVMANTGVYRLYGIVANFTEALY